MRYIMPGSEDMGKKGVRSTKGQGELYDKPKKVVALSLTLDGVDGLDQMALQMGLSRSELVEQIGRRVIPVGPKASLPEKNTDSLGKK